MDSIYFMPEFIVKPWPWFIAGPLLGLSVPLLLILGNKNLGISSSLRHICAACIPAGIPFFKYDWRREQWNLLFVAGIVGGAVIASTIFSDPDPIVVNPDTVAALESLGVEASGALMPDSIFGTDQILTSRGLIFLVLGGFLVGFGTRYAGGCTSGHTINGLSQLQWPSLVATIAFMAGGFITTHLFLPWLLSL